MELHTGAQLTAPKAPLGEEANRLVFGLKAVSIGSILMQHLLMA